ncbi:MAG: hypothetical protein HY021_08490 [Burkholderiales bacterium]|nr:hypothetical protein [Burkholderiales bacterium]
MVSTAMLAGLLAACGGGTDPYRALQAQADEAEAHATQLIENGPCSSDSQCGALKFAEAQPSCSQGRYTPYLLATPSAAAAEALAAEQRRLAQAAVQLAPTPPFVCAAYVATPPRPVCVNRSCGLAEALDIVVVDPPQ